MVNEGHHNEQHENKLCSQCVGKIQPIIKYYKLMKFLCNDSKEFFEFHPAHSLLVVFCRPCENKLMLLIASEEGTLLVYDAGPSTSGYADSHFGSLPSPSSSSTPKLIWSAKLPCTPVSMARANFEELTGLVVILTAEGHLQCCHLGTTPKNFTIPLSSRALIKEHKDIGDKLMKLGSKQTTSQSVNTSKGTVELSLEFIVNNITLLPIAEEPILVGNNQERIYAWKSFLEVDISLILIPMIPLNNVCLSATLDTPLQATLGKNFIERLYEEIKVPMVVRANYDDSILFDAIPNLVIDITVSCFGGYSGAGEELSLMVFHTYTLLPLSAVFSQKIFHAGKENEGIDPTCDPPSMNLKTFDFHFQGCKCPTIPVLFPEFIFSQSDASLKSFELYLFGHGDKKVQLVRRCKEESGEEIHKECVFTLTSFCTLPLYYLTYILAQKLENHATDLGNQISGNSGKPKGFFFQVTPKNSVPIENLLESIDAHRMQRKNVAELNKQLGFLTNQLHMVECCILSRVKDTTPKPIMFSEILLEQFLEKISSCINSLWLSQQKLHSLAKKIRIVLQLVMQLQPECAASSNFKAFRNAISLTVRDAISQGWEERSAANLAYALRGQKLPHPHNFSDGEMNLAEAELIILSCESIKNDILHYVEKFTSTQNK
ncbi:protein PTHB1-like [Hetaerina americana]|uniref:protein PTHB1-like n=1 Tax=Hetaerina americana TaxID=62018 RepID=UPI003A7F4329